MTKSIKELIEIKGKKFEIPEIKEGPFPPSIKKIYSKLNEEGQKSAKRAKVDWGYLKNYSFQ